MAYSKELQAVKEKYALTDEQMTGLTALGVEQLSDLGLLKEGDLTILGVMVIKARKMIAENTAAVAQPPAGPTNPQGPIVLVDPDKQCPHCQALLTQAEKEANRCGTCDRKLYEEGTCPYCGTTQLLHKAMRCLNQTCARKIPSDKGARRRMAYLRLYRHINPANLDNELTAIMADPVRLEMLDTAIEEGEPGQGKPFLGAY